MYGIYDRSFAPRLTLTLFHIGAVVLAAWLLIGDGMARLSTLTGFNLTPGDPARRMLVLVCSIIYCLRLCFTLFYLLRRRVGWQEATTVALWVMVIHLTFAILGGTNNQALGPTALLSLLLYGTGSLLNTGAEYQRHCWKQRSENRGRLYTGGLFRYAMHINYFGDVLLFSGFAGLTGRWAAGIIPMIMAGFFIFVNIPILDRYLAEKYRPEFERYAQTTKKLIPFLY